MGYGPREGIQIAQRLLEFRRPFIHPILQGPGELGQVSLPPLHLVHLSEDLGVKTTLLDRERDEMSQALRREDIGRLELAFGFRLGEGHDPHLASTGVKGHEKERGGDRFRMKDERRAVRNESGEVTGG
jgi:hypothetical protein